MPSHPFILTITAALLVVAVPAPGRAAPMQPRSPQSVTILDELERLRAAQVISPLLEPARAALRERRYDVAIRAVETALPKLELPRDQAAAQDLIGAALHGKGDMNGAIAALRRAMRADPTLIPPMLRLGSIYMLDNRWEDARRVLQQAVTVDPNSRLAYRQLGYVHAEMNNVDGAIEALRRGLGPPDDTAVRIDLAGMLNQRSQFAAAAELLRPIVDASSRNPKALQHRAIAEAGVGQTQTALDLILAARALAPNDEGIVTTVGVLQRTNGLAEQSLATLDAAAKAFPRSAAVQYQRSLTLVALSRPEAAQDAMMRAQDLDPDALIIRRALAGMQTMGDQPGIGLDTFAELAARPGAKPYDFFVLATAYQFAGRMDDAEKAFRDATTRFSDDSATWWKLGALIAQRGRYQEALQPLTRAANLAPRDTRILRTISLAEMRLGKLDEATNTAERMVALEPQNVGARLLLAEFYEQGKRWDKALALYRDLLAQQPNNPILLNNAASMMTELKQAKDAVPLARRAAELMPDQPAVVDTLGWALLESGDAKAAVIPLRRARDLAPDDPRRLYRLAVAEMRAGDPAAARRSLEAALASDAPFPDKPQAQALLARLPR